MIFKYAQHKDKRFPRVDKVKGVKRLRTIIFVILKYNHNRQYPSPFTTPYPSALAGEGYFLEMIILVYRRTVMSVTTTP